MVEAEEEEEEEGATFVRFVAVVDVVLVTFLLLLSVEQEAEDDVDEHFRLREVTSLRRPMTIVAKSFLF